jgi:hypothetical protein
MSPPIPLKINPLFYEKALLLGRDILDTFICIFDRAKGQVLLLDPPDRYEVVHG